MRPDPYKQRRSRQHQARLRASGRAEAGAAPVVRAAPAPRLPSNAARYDEAEDAAEDAYDYGDADALARALSALQTSAVRDAKAEIDLSGASDALFTPELLERVAAVLAGAPLAPGEASGLPAVGWRLGEQCVCLAGARSPAVPHGADVASRLRALRVSRPPEDAPVSPVSASASPEDAWLDSVI